MTERGALIIRESIRTQGFVRYQPRYLHKTLPLLD